jgi:hypothetical protein
MSVPEAVEQKLRQLKLGRIQAEPEALRPALAALELLLVVAGQVAGGALGEEDRAQLVGEVRSFLSSPREAAVVAQARSLAALLG